MRDIPYGWLRNGRLLMRSAELRFWSARRRGPAPPPALGLTAAAIGLLALACAPGCTFDPGGLRPPPDAGVCGDGVVNPGEGCDDGNTVSGDGCDSACRVEGSDCGPQTCANGCCDASGVCQPGTGDGACGSDGVACADCGATGLVCLDGQCVQPGTCTPGETESCERCGTRTCQPDRFFGPCTGQGVCEAGEMETGGACGECGTEERTCDSTCQWTTWTCANVPATDYYADSDADGYGDPASQTGLCDPPGSGWVTAGGDCDDGNPDIHPGASEICGNCVDEDCDGRATPCDAGATMTFTPDPPLANQFVEVTAQSVIGHTCVQIRVVGPGFSVLQDPMYVIQGPPHQWAFHLTLGAAGAYQFTLETGPVPCSSQQGPQLCVTRSVQ